MVSWNDNGLGNVHQNDLKKAKELSASVAALGGYRYILPPTKKFKKKQYNSLLPDFLQGKVKQKSENVKPLEKRLLISDQTVKKQHEVIPIIPEKELLYETPETLVGKLNALSGALRKHVIQDFPEIKDLVPLVIEAIKQLKGNDRLDISHIRNGEQLSRIAQRVDMNDMRWHGSGGTSVVQIIPKQFSLSSQLNGVTKIFTIPANTAITGILSSSTPFVFDPFATPPDYMGSGTTTLTFGTGIDAPSMLAAGQTIIVQYY